MQTVDGPTATTIPTTTATTTTIEMTDEGGDFVRPLTLHHYLDFDNTTTKNAHNIYGGRIKQRSSL